jgi:3-isopropylmalate/(R)-2-methylmalate dehydratase small subunit
MMAMGLRSVIASSFGDIFFANCFQNGMLPVLLPTEVIQSLASEVIVNPTARPVTVDLPRQLVISPLGTEYPFEIAALRKESLLEGLDEISLTLKREPQIAAFQQRDHERRPWIYQPLEAQS